MAANALSSSHVEPAARLFEEYGPQLYRFCLGRLRSREEAEDALQSTFLRVHKALARGVVPEYEAAWLYKIAHNVCLTRRAVLGRRAERPLDDLPIAAPESRGDDLIGLADALAGLTPKLRQAILLREWQGLSYVEIAAAMETSVSAVETLLFRARRELATALEGERKERKRLVGLVAALLGRLLELAPAKLATGAALLALGGAGLGTAVAVEPKHEARPAPAADVVGAALVAPARAVAKPVARPTAQHALPRTMRARVPDVPHGGGGSAVVAPEPTEPTAAAPAATPTEVPPAPPAQPAAPAAAPAPTPAPTPTATVTTSAATVVVPSVSVPDVPALPPVATPAVTVTVTTPALPPLDLGH